MIMLKNSKMIFVTVAVLIAAATRLFPHPVNFTAVGAMAIFGGSMLNDKRLAVLIPLAALWLSDLFLNNVIYSTGSFTLIHSGFYWTYIPFVLMALGAHRFISKLSVGKIATTSLVASTFFFLVSNFGSWVGMEMYSKDFSGLIAAYVAGLPFFPNTVAGDLFFNAVLFGGFALASAKFPRLAKQQA